MRVNLGSIVLMAKHAVPSMAAHNAGSIVNISSIVGLIGGFPSLFYPVSKGSIVPLTRVMALQHGSHGIRVNCVAPGLVYTPMVTTRGMSDEVRERRRLAGALKIEGDAWDVAYALDGGGLLLDGCWSAQLGWRRTGSRDSGVAGGNAYPR